MRLIDRLAGRAAVQGQLTQASTGNRFAVGESGYHVVCQLDSHIQVWKECIIVILN